MTAQLRHARMLQDDFRRVRLVQFSSIADRLHLLDNGGFAWSGSGAELMSSPEILSAYLGG